MNDVLYKVSEWDDGQVMPRTVKVDGDDDLETELKENLAYRHDVTADEIELVAF
jgi:hypothetical protein